MELETCLAAGSDLVQCGVEWASGEPWGYYVGIVLLVCRLFVSFAPESLTEKLPDKLMWLINKLALSSNSMTDNKGNKVK